MLFISLHCSSYCIQMTAKDHLIFPWSQKLENQQVMWTAVGSWCNFSIASSHFIFHHWSNTSLLYLYLVWNRSKHCFMFCHSFLFEARVCWDKLIHRAKFNKPVCFQFVSNDIFWSAVSFCTLGVKPSVIISTACSSRFLVRDVRHLARLFHFTISWLVLFVHKL